MAPPAVSSKPKRLRRVLRALAISGALAYPTAIVCIILSFRFIGEQWWVTLVAMYLPRVGFAIPLPFILLAAYYWGPRWLLPVQMVSVVLLVVPLMGFRWSWGVSAPGTSVPVVRVLSYNISYGDHGIPGIAAQVRAFSPNVVLLQAVQADRKPELLAAFDGWHLHLDGQFLLASRFPIQEAFVPPPIQYAGGTGGAHFVRCTLDAPFGAVDVFNVHTTSPREGLEELRRGGLQDALATGRFLEAQRTGVVEFNAYRRRRQIGGIAAVAGASARPVIIAGDTNLPGLSWILGEYLGGFRDAFSVSGRGFGYTFPASRPWMRIDRILTNDRLRTVEFSIGQTVASEHLCVFAVIGREP